MAHFAFVGYLIQGIGLLFMVVFMVFMGLFIPLDFASSWGVDNALDALWASLPILGLIALYFRSLSGKSNQLNIKHYQLLPIKTKTLECFLILKSLLNPTNYIGFCFFIPYLYRLYIAHEASWAVATLFFATLILLTISNVVLSELIARVSQDNWTPILVFSTIATITFALYKGLSPDMVQEIIRGINIFFSTGMAAFCYLLIAIGCFYAHRHFLRVHWYEKASTQHTQKAFGYAFAGTQQAGQTAMIFRLIYTQLIRTRRIYAIILPMIVFLLYAAIFKCITNDSSGDALFLMTSLSGFSMTIPYIIAGQSAFFNGIMTWPIDSKKYLLATYYLVQSANVLSIILCIPLYIFVYHITLFQILVISSTVLGITGYFALYAAMYNKQYINMNANPRSRIRNFDFFFFTIIFSAVIIMFILITLGIKYHSVGGILLIFYLLLIVLHRPIIGLICKYFRKRKYKLIDGFNQR